MQFSGTLTEFDTISKPATSFLRGLAHELAAQAMSGTGPRSLCQAYTAASAAAKIATQPHVAAALTTVVDACPRTARRKKVCTSVNAGSGSPLPGVMYFVLKGRNAATPALRSKCCRPSVQETNAPAASHLAAIPDCPGAQHRLHTGHQGSGALAVSAALPPAPYVIVFSYCPETRYACKFCTSGHWHLGSKCQHDIWGPDTCGEINAPYSAGHQSEK